MYTFRLHIVLRAQFRFETFLCVCMCVLRSLAFWNVSAANSLRYGTIPVRFSCVLESFPLQTGVFGIVSRIHRSILDRLPLETAGVIKKNCCIL